MITAPVPDALGPVVAWRRWHVWGIPDPGGGEDLIRLGSIPQADYRWPSLEAIPARCRKRNPCGEAPSIGCSCGYYGMDSKTFSAWLNSRSFGRFVVIGQVYLWGRVVVCERGWKAQFAYPKALYVASDVWRGSRYKTYLRALCAYGVPVRGCSLVEVDQAIRESS